jgi:hypothetical protein
MADLPQSGPTTANEAMSPPKREENFQFRSEQVKVYHDG